MITCPSCGTVKPTHPEDAARGLFVRYRSGTLKVGGLVCDMCNVPLNQGDKAVAVSQPNTLGNWEQEYFKQ